MTATLQLHWPLDQEPGRDGSVPGVVGGRGGVVEGTPAPTAGPDVRFGSCLTLAPGQALTGAVPDDRALRFRTYSLSVWVALDRPEAGATVELGGQPGGAVLAVEADGTVRHVPAVGDPLRAPDRPLSWNDWHHVVLTGDAAELRTYVDGVLAASRPRPVTELADSTGGIVLGRPVAGGPGRVAGRVAHLRLYDDALDPVRIRRDMADDGSVLSAFVRSHPLDAELTDQAGQPVLYIEDGAAAQRLTLRLTNTSRRAVELRPLGTGPVSAENHHVAVALRRGTLAPSSSPALGVPGWTLGRSADGNTLYLAADTPSQIARGDSVELPVDGLNGDGTDGTHGTRAEVSFSRVGYVGEVQELSATRLLFLDVVNDRGRAAPPFEVGFVGGNRVLSDGSASTLTIALSPVSREVGVDLNGPPTAAAAPPASEIVVSFETRDAGEFRGDALTATGDASSVALTLVRPTGVPDLADPAKPDPNGTSWTTAPTQRTTMAPRTAVEFEMSSITALPDPGTAVITVAYRNVPGYRDGSIPLTVERCPLLFEPTRVRPGPNVAEVSPLRLVRPSEAPGRGSQILLDLVQEEPAATDPNPAPPDASPAIRFGQGDVWSNRVESGRGGVRLVDGDLSSRTLADLTAGTGYVDRLRVGGVPQGPRRTGLATVVSPGPDPHLQLRREITTTTRGKQVFLELYQDDDHWDRANQTFPSILFHHSNNFFHRIEARLDGVMIKTGELASDDFSDVYAKSALFTGEIQMRDPVTNGALHRITADADGLTLTNVPAGGYSDVYARWAHVSGGVSAGDVTLGTGGLTIGGVTLDANDLAVLKKFAGGQLTFQLVQLNSGKDGEPNAEGEYLFAGNDFDGNHRPVYTYRTGESVLPNGRWKLVSPQ